MSLAGASDAKDRLLWETANRVNLIFIFDFYFAVFVILRIFLADPSPRWHRNLSGPSVFISYRISTDKEIAMQAATAGTATTAAGGVATDETDRLIASNKVDGTAVYNRQGERLGSVYNFMVDKRSGQVEYAVMSFGGFLGIGDSYHPLPWKTLKYNTSMGGYVVDLDKGRLQGAPSYAASEIRTGAIRATAAGSTTIYGPFPGASSRPRFEGLLRRTWVPPGVPGTMDGMRCG